MRFTAPALIRLSKTIVVANQSCCRNFRGLLKAMEGSVIDENSMAGLSKTVHRNVPPWLKVVDNQYTTFFEYDNMFFLDSDREADSPADSAIVDEAATAG